MEKFISGAVFCTAASMLESAKYIAAAVYMAGNASQSKELFQNGLSYVGPGPDIMAAAALACGILLIIWGIIDSREK